MEIVTYIVNGNLTHQDSMGSVETLGRGGIQYMSAGTGVRHSERNGTPEPLRFIQMWFIPREQGLPPRYGGFSGDAEARKNQLAHLVSDIANKAVVTPVELNQGVDLYAAELDPGTEVTHLVPAGSVAYAVCLEGKIELSSAGESVSLAAHDAADLNGGSTFSFTAGPATSHFLLIVMEPL